MLYMLSYDVIICYICYKFKAKIWIMCEVQIRGIVEIIIITNSIRLFEE